MNCKITVHLNILNGLLLLLFASHYLPGANSSPYIINDDRIRTLDITPVLGRGYSIMTNSFQSTCLLVTQTTIPSYNYAYTFTDLTSSSTTTEQRNDAVRSSFAYYWVRKNVQLNTSSSSTVTVNKRYIVSNMKIERYYASVREDVSTLSDDALTLLGDSDWVGFFKACGPTYVRGIRRAQEVTAIFEFVTSDSTAASDYFKRVQRSYRRRWWWSPRRRTPRETTRVQTTSSEITSSLKINIKGWGLGLGVSGAEVGMEGGENSMIATSLEEYQEVMRYAFRSMTQSKDSVHIGQVWGMEVVPWVENTQFQVAAEIQDENVVIPLPRSLIPKAHKKADPFNTTGFINEDDSTASPPINNTRDEFTCKGPFDIDMFGYCCDSGALFNPTTGKYDATSPEARICKPLRNLDKTLVKNNMVANGEFVARLDRSVRYKLNQMSTLERCVSAARSFPERFDYYSLKAVDTVKYDGKYDPAFTVKELKLALDPFNDYSVLKHMAKELDEFIQMFYSPCMAALFGSKIGTTTDTDTSYFMAYPWHSHEECLHLSCLGNSMRWDRIAGGCVPSLITGTSAKTYTLESGQSEGKCAYDVDAYGDTEKCKYTNEELTTTYNAAKNCWDVAVPEGNIDFFMENYCMPEITGEIGKNIEFVLASSAADKCNQKRDGDYTKKFFLRQQWTRYVLDSSGAQCKDNNALFTYRKHSGTNQQFKYHYVDQTIEIENCGSPLYVLGLSDDDCLTTDSDIRVVLKPKPDTVTDDYKFVFAKDGTIRNKKCYAKALAFPRTRMRTNLVLQFADPEDWRQQLSADIVPGQY